MVLLACHEHVYGPILRRENTRLLRCTLKSVAWPSAQLCLVHICPNAKIIQVLRPEGVWHYILGL